MCVCSLQADSLVCLLLALLLSAVLMASPEGLRQQAHCWLLRTVARAPLMLQPLLLLCPPARNAYRQCRCGLCIPFAACQRRLLPCN